MVTAHGAGSGPEPVEIVPLTVVTRSFPARPSALPDVRDFVRRQLTGKPVSEEDVRTLGERVAQVLLEGAGVAGSIQVSLRIFPHAAEVDVLFAVEAAQPLTHRPDHYPPAPRRPADDTAAERDTVIGAGRSARDGRSAPRSTAPGGTRPSSPDRYRAADPGGHPAAEPGGYRAADPWGGSNEPGGHRPPAPAGAPSFAAWLAAHLRREGLSIQAAARRLDVSAKTVSRWMAGTTEPRLRDLYRIREEFGEPPIH